MKKLLNLLKKTVIAAVLCLSIWKLLPPAFFPFDFGISTCQDSPNPDQTPFDESEYT